MSAEEKKPLVEKEEEPPAAEPFYMKYAVPLAIGFYVFVAVLKTMLTKIIFNGNDNPVGFSAVSGFATCLVLVPMFLIKPSSWSAPSMKIMPGLCLVSALVAMDLALANIAVSMLTLAIQQCVIATNPAFVVTIESIVNKKIFHPLIYVTVATLCVGPILAQLGAKAAPGEMAGIVVQILGVICSACKSVFTHSVMHACKKELGAFAFLFWIDTLILIILVPWALFNGELIDLFKQAPTVLDQVDLWFAAVLGGVRFFSQLILLRVSTPTTLACANVAFQAINIYLSIALFGTPLTMLMVLGTLVTLSAASTYTYFKVSKVLEKDAGCQKIHEDFKSCCSCGGKDKEAV